MNFGDYECFSIEMGSFYFDGGPMFGVVPKILWEKEIPADGNNLIHMKARSLLIQGNGKNILVDTGLGNKLSEKLKKIYGIEEYSTDLDRSLSEHELTCNDITDVIITHLHFDHTGGSTSVKNGKIVPTFPNATYYIQKDQWDAALNPNIRDISSFVKENFIPLEKSGVLKLLDGPIKLFDGIDILVTNGHTPGQQHPLVKGINNALFYCADLIPSSAHLPIAWHMAFDINPLIIMEEKEQFLGRALKENWILFFEHDPLVAAASIKHAKNGIIIDHNILI